MLKLEIHLEENNTQILLVTQGNCNERKIERIKRTETYYSKESKLN